MVGDGYLYVVDSGNFRIQVFDRDGNFIRQWGELGSGFSQFSRLRAIAADPEGNLYVSGTQFGNAQIFSPTGRLLLSLGAQGVDGQSGQFRLIAGVVVDETGRVYLLGQYYKRLSIFQ